MRQSKLCNTFRKNWIYKSIIQNHLQNYTFLYIIECPDFTFGIAFSSNYFRNLSKSSLEYHKSQNPIRCPVSSHPSQQSLVCLNFDFDESLTKFHFLPLLPDPFCLRPRFFGFAGNAVFVPLSEDKYPDCRGIILTDGIVVGFCIDCINALNNFLHRFACA